jgi:hypothetical protein
MGSLRDQWLQELLSNAEGLTVDLWSLLLPSLVMLGIVSAVFIFFYLRTNAHWMSGLALTSCLIIGANFQGCMESSSSSTQKGISSGAVGDIEEISMPRHFNPEGTNSPPPNIRLFDGSTQAITEQLILADVLPYFARFGITKNVGVCDELASNAPCYRYLEDWSGSTSLTSIDNVRTALTECSQSNTKRLMLDLQLDVRRPRDKAKTVRAVYHGEPFLVLPVCVDFADQTKPKVYILNPAHVSTQVQTTPVASFETNLVKVVERAGYFTASSSLSEPSGGHEIVLTAEQGSAASGSAITLPNTTDRPLPGLSIVIYPEYDMPWIASERMGSTVEDYRQTPFRNGNTVANVFPGNGELSLHEIDHLYPVPQQSNSLTLQRTYRSSSNRFGPLGWSWDHSMNRYQRFMRFTGQGNATAVFTYTGEGRYFTRSPGIFWGDIDPELKPESTHLYKEGVEQFDLSGRLVSQCDPYTGNCLYYFYQGGLLRLVVDQVFLRNQSATLDQFFTQALNILEPIDAIRSDIASTSSVIKGASASIRSTFQAIHGHFIFFNYNSNAQITFAWDKSGKAIRYIYGDTEGNRQALGNFLVEVESLVHERNQYSGGTYQGEWPNGFTWYVTSLYRYTYQAAGLPGWKGALLSSVSSYQRENHLESITYESGVTDSSLGTFSKRPVVTEITSENLEYEFVYNVQENPDPVCGNSEVYQTNVRASRGDRQIVEKYLYDDRAFLVQSHGPTETASDIKLFEAKVDPKTLRYSETIIRGNKSEFEFDENGFLKTSKQCQPMEGAACGTQCSSPRVTSYDGGQGSSQFTILPYYYDLSGSQTPHYVKLPDITTDMGAVSQTYITEATNCQGMPGRVRRSETNQRSGAECIKVEDPAGGFLVYENAVATTETGLSNLSRVLTNEMKPLTLAQAGQTGWTSEWKPTAEVHQPDFTSQAGYPVLEPSNGWTHAFINTNAGGGNLTQSGIPPTKVYRDYLGNIVFEQNPLGGLTRQVFSYRFPVVTELATFVTESKIPTVSINSTPLNSVLSLFQNARQGDAKESLAQALGICNTGNASDCYSSGQPLVGNVTEQPYTTLSLSSAAILNIHSDTFGETYPLDAPSRTFSKGAGSTQISYFSSAPLQGLPQNVKTYFSPGMTAGQDGYYPMSAAELSEVYFRYCSESSSCAGLSPRASWTTTDSRGVVSEVIYRNSHNRAPIGSRVDKTAIGGLVSESTQGGTDGAGFNHYGLPTASHTKIGERTISSTFTYNSWNQLTRSGSEYVSASASASEVIDYLDEAAGIVAQTESTDFFGVESITQYSQYDKWLRPLRTTNPDHNSVTTISCPIGCDREQTVESTFPVLISGSGPQGTQKAIRRIKYDSYGNAIETTAAANSLTDLANRSIVRLKTHPLGFVTETRTRPPGSSADVIVMQHVPDTFGNIFLEYERDASILAVSGPRHRYSLASSFIFLEDGGRNRSQPLQWYAPNNPADHSAAVRWSLPAQLKMEFGFLGPNCDPSTGSQCADGDLVEFTTLSQELGVFNQQGSIALRCLSDGNSPCMSSPVSLEVGKSVYDAANYAWKHELTDLNSNQITTNIMGEAREASLVTAASGGGLIQSTSIDRDLYSGAPLVQIQSHKLPWLTSLRASETTSVVDAFGRPTTVAGKEAGRTTMTTNYTYGSGQAPSGVSSLAQLYSANLSQVGTVSTQVSYVYASGAFQHLPVTVNFAASSSGGVQNQSGTGQLNLAYSHAGDLVSSQYVPHAAANSTLPRFTSTLNTQVSALGRITSSELTLTPSVESSNRYLDIFRVAGEPCPESTTPDGSSCVYDRMINNGVGHEMTLNYNYANKRVSGAGFFSTIGLNFDQLGQFVSYELGVGERLRDSGSIQNIYAGANRLYGRGSVGDGFEAQNVDRTAGSIGYSGLLAAFWDMLPWTDSPLNLKLTENPENQAQMIPGSSNQGAYRGFGLIKENLGHGPFLKTVQPFDVLADWFFDRRFYQNQTVPRTTASLATSNELSRSCNHYNWSMPEPKISSGSWSFERGINDQNSQEFTNSILADLSPDPGVTSVQYDERGLKRTYQMNFYQQLPEGGQRHWRIVRNFGYDASTNPIWMEVLVYFNSPTEGYGSGANDLKLIRATTFLNYWMPTPSQSAFDKGSFLAKQEIKDTGPVRLGCNGDWLSAPHPATYQWNQAAICNGQDTGEFVAKSLAGIFYFAPGQSAPEAAFQLKNPGDVCASGSLEFSPPNTAASFCVFRIEKDQRGNVISMQPRAVGLTTSNYAEGDAREISYYSPYDLAVRYRITNRDISSSSSQSSAKPELYLAFDPRYQPSFPSFGAGGEFFDGALVGGLYEPFSGRVVRQESNPFLADACDAAPGELQAVQKFLALGKGYDESNSSDTPRTTRAQMVRQQRESQRLKSSNIFYSGGFISDVLVRSNMRARGYTSVKSDFVDLSLNIASFTPVLGSAIAAHESTVVGNYRQAGIDALYAGVELGSIVFTGGLGASGVAAASAARLGFVASEVGLTAYDIVQISRISQMDY